MEQKRYTEEQIAFASLRQADSGVPVADICRKMGVSEAWVIVGGESGPGARPMDLSWAQAIRDQCLEASVPFFLKQLGGVRR
jgi:protein gp37